jgi:hypothetical protein
MAFGVTADLQIALPVAADPALEHRAARLRDRSPHFNIASDTENRAASAARLKVENAGKNPAFGSRERHLKSHRPVEPTQSRQCGKESSGVVTSPRWCTPIRFRWRKKERNACRERALAPTEIACVPLICMLSRRSAPIKDETNLGVPHCLNREAVSLSPSVRTYTANGRSSTPCANPPPCVCTPPCVCAPPCGGIEATSMSI